MCALHQPAHNRAMTLLHDTLKKHTTCAGTFWLRIASWPPCLATATTTTRPHRAPRQYPTPRQRFPRANRAYPSPPTPRHPPRRVITHAEEGHQRHQVRGLVRAGLALLPANVPEDLDCLLPPCGQGTASQQGTKGRVLQKQGGEPGRGAFDKPRPRTEKRSPARQLAS